MGAGLTSPGCCNCGSGGGGSGITCFGCTLTDDPMTVSCSLGTYTLNMTARGVWQSSWIPFGPGCYLQFNFGPGCFFQGRLAGNSDGTGSCPGFTPDQGILLCCPESESTSCDPFTLSGNSTGCTGLFIPFESIVLTQT